MILAEPSLYAVSVTNRSSLYNDNLGSTGYGTARIIPILTKVIADTLGLARGEYSNLSNKIADFRAAALASFGMCGCRNEDQGLQDLPQHLRGESTSNQRMYTDLQ
ncbi:MAG: hypothetical protein QS748_11155 [Candidatus Endonucleobacter bathymodioli]|uniref:Uncharacterized protein n=1 Tax=Candidatus Endonucleibacter bathymodioli TaxID=539814 RepID=A0AA90NMU4_9GAMM|nr:hypothetical protein [Candidatus Endonucleobacter bathymodioli]